MLNSHSNNHKFIFFFVILLFLMIKINTVGDIIGVIYFFFFSKDAYK